MKPLFAALLLTPLAAQVAVAAAPDAGSLLQQIRPPAPPAPSPAQPGARIQSPDGARLPESAPFNVKAIRITGNTLFETPILHGLVAEGEGKALTLAQVGDLAARITRYYRSHGYTLARAIVPAQAIQDGVVTLQVIEARYGKVTLANQSRVQDGLLQDTIAPLKNGQMVAQRQLDETLLLLSDLPATGVDAVLKPGDAIGSSDLEIQATALPGAAADVVLDNYGSSSTGRARASAVIHVFNPLRHGDTLTIGALTSGSRLSYGRLGYESTLNGRGTRLGGGYSALRYKLGDSLATLGANGTAQVGSLWLKHPLVRSRSFNLYAQLQYDRKQVRDRIDATAIRTDRHLHNWILGLSGDARDGLLPGGIDSWSIGLTSGRVGFDDAAAQAVDAATAQTKGSFAKLNASYGRLQSLSATDTLYLSANGQWAEGNLDSAEKLAVGGPASVRAYPMGIVSADSAYVGSIEWRHDFGQFAYGFLQGVAFVDAARVKVNEATWAAGPNTGTLSGAGVGVNWAGPNGWRARAYVASRLGSRPAIAGTASATRAWVEVAKGF